MRPRFNRLALLLALSTRRAPPLVHSAWAPVNWNDFQCLDSDWVASLPESSRGEWWARAALWDDRAGNAPPRRLAGDARMSAAVLEHFTNHSSLAPDKATDGGGACATTRADAGRSFQYYGWGAARDLDAADGHAARCRAAPGRANNTGWRYDGRLDSAVVLVVEGWDTHIIASWVANIMLKEVLGYPTGVLFFTSPVPRIERYAKLATIAAVDEGGGGGVARGADDGARQAAWTTAFGEGAGNFSRTPAHANVEQFGTFDTAFQKLFSARDGIAAAGPTGYPGREGLFTTQAFIDDTLGGGDGGDGAANGSSSGGGLDAGWWRTWTDARIAGALRANLTHATRNASQATCLAQAASGHEWAGWDAADCVDGFLEVSVCDRAIDRGLVEDGRVA